MVKRQQIQKQATNITTFNKSKYLERHKLIPPLCQGCDIWKEIS